MDRPLFSVICGTAVTAETLLRWGCCLLIFSLLPSVGRFTPRSGFRLRQWVWTENRSQSTIWKVTCWGIGEEPGMPSESGPVSEQDNGAGGIELVVTSPHWRLRVDWGDRLDPWELVHLASGRAVADESYCYQLTVSGVTHSGFHGGPVGCRRVRPLDWSAEPQGDGTTLTLLGQLDFGPQGPTGLRVEHRITLAGTGEVVEQLSLLNHAGQDRLRLDG